MAFPLRFAMRLSTAFPAVDLISALLAAPESAAQTFTKITAGTSFNVDLANSTGSSWVDVDGDQDLDLYVCNRGLLNFLYRNDGAGVLTRVNVPVLTARASIGSTWADYDNDGDLDVCLAGEPAYLLRNDGGTFADVTSLFGPPFSVSGWGAAWSDYDNDGYVDLVIAFAANGLAAPNAPNAQFHNNGDGTFEKITTGPVVTGLAPYTVPTWSDYDDDGDSDLFIASGPADGTTAVDYLYRNLLTESGAATFERITTSPIATDLVDGQVWNWIDYDNDRDLDAFLTNWWGGPPAGMPDNLYRNNGGVYQRILTGDVVTNAGFSLSQLWQDFDNDGDLDLFVTNGVINQPNRYYRNNGNGTFTRAFSAITSDLGASWAATAGDYDDDGDIDIFVGNAIYTLPGGPDWLYRNDTVNGNHWLGVKLTGVLSNASAIGAKVHVKAVINGSPRWQRQEVSAQNTFCGQNSLKLHFGLGNAAVVESVLVEWPSGTLDTAANVPVDDCLMLDEGQTLPVAVTLLRLGAVRGDRAVVVTWAAAADVSDHARFFVHRQAPGEDRLRVSEGFDGAGEFAFEDADAPDGAVDYWIEEVSRTAETRWHGPLHIEAAGPFGGVVELSPASPNPFRSSTTFRFSVIQAGHVRLDVFDASGRVIAELVDRRVEPGELVVAWDGTDARGRSVAPGLYFYRLAASGESRTRKILRLGDD